MTANFSVISALPQAYGTNLVAGVLSAGEAQSLFI
jgi:hypothetical protein